MNHEVYANPNENYQILINILPKAKEIYMPKTTIINVMIRKKSG